MEIVYLMFRAYLTIDRPLAKLGNAGFVRQFFARLRKKNTRVPGMTAAVYCTNMAGSSVNSQRFTEKRLTINNHTRRPVSPN